MEADAHRITVDALAQEISSAQAAGEQRRRRDEDDVRGDIRAALNRHGWSNSGRPSVLRHIVQMHANREITARHIGNHMPPHEVGVIEMHPDKYWLSMEDARKVRVFLLPDEGASDSAIGHAVAPLAEAVQEPESAGAAARKRSKLTDEQREQIRLRAGQGEAHQKLADEFGVTRQAVSKLCKDPGNRGERGGPSPFPSVATNRR
ncbi:hypothetical protein N4S61_05895 [Burkholderia pseudomallei]|uniref:hypothetical protein n=1 Tax=Burkholderia TaxID=32008 RepID=UPI00053221EE|nr:MULTISPECIES: hypothetical protein [Burkholderia]KGS09889.1 sigma-70, region 4 family protein [Burkholderia pseudomallei MSHR5608]MCT7345553.1 hypothetical protein [Burkholderia pseudomallei]MCT7922350.1 hypothetical protein [Burkholderia pseudomallei]